MMTFFLQAAPDSLTQATQAVVENIAVTKELSLFEFFLKTNKNDFNADLGIPSIILYLFRVLP